MERIFRNPYIALGAVLTLAFGLGLATVAKQTLWSTQFSSPPVAQLPPEPSLGGTGVW